jgi:hypothetical protein
MIPMRDGTRLSADIYFPARERCQLPLVLSRTPYDKRTFRDPGSEAWRFVSAGFAYAVQDLRGTHESEGECRVSEFDRCDGFDTVAWLAAQPWSNGRVGTYGCSQRGEVQYQLAAMRPPGLACAIVQAGGSVLYGETSRSYLHMGGVLNLTIASWYRRWLAQVRPQFPRGCDPALLRQASAFHPLAPVFAEMRIPEDFEHLPVCEIQDRVGAPPNEWPELIRHPPGDPWWRRKGHVTRHDFFDVPMLHVNSWFDFGVNETLVMAGLVRERGLSERTRANQFVVISAAGHCGSERLVPGERIGDMVLGDPSYDFFGLYIDWFRHWLVDEGGDYAGRRYVQYYLLNRDRWCHADAWPPVDARERSLYLHAGRGANALAGDGRLLDTPASVEGRDAFTYDPLHPVPTVGGVLWSSATRPPSDLRTGPADQEVVECREDVLVYTSEPMDGGTSLTGPVSVELHVRSSARDTDFSAKLCYVTPLGRSLWLTEGILRLRYWAGLDRERFVPPGTVVAIRIDLKSVGIWLEPGSRLRLQVSSSNFPRFERNLNTGGGNFDEKDPLIARNEVLFGPAYPSRVRIWLRPAGD